MRRTIFEPVSTPFDFAAAEHDTIRYWQENQIYHKSLEQRRDGAPFVFYEGPPTANGMPHPGHCLTRTIKDIFPRYKTMQGYFCERKAGWDTHGLPVEIEVCKELGIIDGGKEAIETYGVEKFNRTCIESVFRYQKEWEELTNRIGFWVDLEDAYVTYHQSYVESVWWALKQLFDRGLLYQGHKVVWWWAQGGTALSAGEVGEGYRDTDDPAITVRLKLDKESTRALGLSHAPAYLLVWTTTPWTLLSNCAVAVGPDLEYGIVKTTQPGGTHEFYILAADVTDKAADLSEKYFNSEVEILRVVKGSDLLGLQYEPLFQFDAPRKLEGDAPSDKHWVLISGDFVSLEQGTGLVHIAPAFGEDDYRVCKENNVGFLCYVKPDGTFDSRVTLVDPFDQSPIAGQFCKDADKAIIRLLKEAKAIIRQDQYRHPYPFCPRAENDPLIQYARKSWFIRTSDFVEDFLTNNRELSWQPEHIRDGRFGNFLENNVDWALSRERYWGTPLPVWICEQTGHMECVSTYDALMAKPDVQGMEVWNQAKAENPALNDNLKIHKPYIDAIHYQSPKHPESRMRRVTEVIDVWFDAGCMPFAQWGYPHLPGSDAQLQERFPADFISEAIDQTRGWFYALLAISTLVFGKEKAGWPIPFKNCICLGHILGEDGLKLSKRLKNYADPKVVFEKYSADALRWSFISKNPPTNSSRLSERIVEESQRELLIRWFNVYSFFVIYANLDGFDPGQAPEAFFDGISGNSENSGTSMSQAAADTEATYVAADERSELDRWILHELNRTTLEITDSMDTYETYPAAKAITDFVDALSNWYVRRSRARFWASEWSQDKANAYWTLYECLLKLARLAAPFVPFFSEVTWRNLVKPLSGVVDSVHLASYPVADKACINYTLLDEMAATREAVTLGLNARRIENIKVRQPLQRCDLIVANITQRDGLERHRNLIMEELNIKELHFSDTPEAFVSYDVRPNFKVLGPRFGKQVQTIKKLLSEGDGAALYTQLQEGHVTLELEGNTIQLSPDEIDVRLIAKEGFTAAQGHHMVAVLSTEITEALRNEGLCREIIRSLQDIRKEQGLAYDARIAVVYQTEANELQQVMASFAETIANEVLAVSLQQDASVATGKDDQHKVVKIDDNNISFSIKEIS